MKNKPIIFANDVIIGLSTIHDGDMRTIGKTGAELAKVYENRHNFLQRHEMNSSDTALVMIDYETDDFCRYMVANDDWRGRGMLARTHVAANDGLATTTKNLALFLPLADCLGAVIYDLKNHAIMVSHLGRHSTEQFGARKSIEFMAETFATDPNDVKVWLSPAAGAENYPLFAFDNRSLRNVNAGHFISAGVLAKNISGENIDTTIDPNYYSHSVAQKVGEKVGKRFAIVAKMR